MTPNEIIESITSILPSLADAGDVEEAREIQNTIDRLYPVEELTASEPAWIVLDKHGNESPHPYYRSRHDAEFVASQVLGWSVEERYEVKA